MITRYSLLIMASLALTACSKDYLSVHTDSFTAEDLASYKVGSPDARRHCPSLGQRLIIRWDFRDCCEDATHIAVRIRHYDRSEQALDIPLDTSTGIFVHCIADQDYLCSGGIMTWRVEARCGDKICMQACHQLWAELIEVASAE